MPMLRDKKLLGGLPTAYVCEKKVCKFPTTDPAVVRKQIDSFLPLE